jgi:SAM-dependent methyltransferase
MIIREDIFKKLVEDAWHQGFSGWDFVYLSGRMVQTSTSWDYRQIVLQKIPTADLLLDLDTGGGEFLSSLQPLPRHTYATEAYPPNVPIAKACLEPLGVRVCETPANGPLPFDVDSFDLVINRHGDISAAEIHRILKPGGRFITQQVGGRNNIRLNEILQDKVEFRDSNGTLDGAVRQLEEAGLKITDRREEYPPVEFTDIGAVVYYLKAIPWQVGGFSPEKYYTRLGKIHNIIQEKGKFASAAHRFFIEAQKG